MNKYFIKAMLINLVSIVLLCGVSPMSMAANNVNLNIPQVIPQSTVPFMAVPPTIDGVIGADEWNTFHVSKFTSQQRDLLQPRYGEFWIGCDGKRLYIAVRSAIHPTAGIIANNIPNGNVDIGEVIYDDSIELWIDNSPGNISGQYYQIMVNSKGALYDSSYERKDKIAQKYWRAAIEQAHTVKDNIWSAEFAINLSSLNINNPEQQLAMRVCRNYKYPWDQSRWAPLVRAFDTPDTMPKIQFVKQAPIVSEIGFQSKDGIDIGIEVNNPTKHQLPIHVKIGGNAQDQPRYYRDWDINLEPGEKRKLSYQTPFFTPGDYPALGEFLITGPDKQIYYHRDVKWQTNPANIWDTLASTNIDDAVKCNISFLPTSHTLRWKSAFNGWSEKDSIKKVRIKVLNEEKKEVFSGEADVMKNWTSEGTLILKELKPGKYQVAFFFDGKTISTEPLKSLTFQYENNFPWLNNNIGISDDVIPPFTPLKVKGRNIDAVLRQHIMNNTGMWSQVKSIGKDLLNSPMTFDVRQKGKIQRVYGKLDFTETKPNRVTAVSKWKAGSLRGKTTSEMDIDGCMKVTLELSQNDKTPVDSVELVIPLCADQVSLMHSCGEGLRSNYAGAIPDGNGIVWESKYASRDKLLGTFLPYLYVGGPERGLVWFASNDKDWVIDLKDEVSALAIERKEGTVFLRVRLIQKAAILTKTHRIVFGLQATPVKPMPTTPDWRTWGVTSGGKFEALLLGMCMYWGGHLYGVTPLNNDYTVIQKIAQSKKEGKRDDAFFTAYTKAHPEIKNEINWSASPGKADAIIPYTNLRGENMAIPEWLTYQDEWRKSNYTWRIDKSDDAPVDFSCIPVKSRQDYLLYTYRDFLRNGFDGIYWDNICIYNNENPLTGNSYIREDGQLQPDTDIWEMRELTRRTAVLFHQMGKRNLTMPHMTNSYLLPVFSWTTINFDWEWKFGGSDFQDRFTREYIRAASIGRQGGNVPVILSGITEVTDPVLEKWVERTRAGVCLTHELIVYQADSLYIRIRKHLFNQGYGTDACKTYNYWDKQPVITINNIDAAWLVVQGKESMTIIISDYGKGGDAQIKVDTKKLGLSEDFIAVNWENIEQRYSAQNGIITIPNIKQHDLRVLTIQNTKK